MKNKLRIGESTHSTVSLEPTHPIAEPSDAIGNASEEEGDEDEEEVGEDEIQKLEEEVKKMAKKVEEYRSTLPNQLKSSYSSLLSELRPTFSLLDQIDIAEPVTSSGPHSGKFSSICLSGVAVNFKVCRSLIVMEHVVWRLVIFVSILVQNDLNPVVF